MKNTPLYLKILIGMAIGSVMGLLAVRFNFGEFVLDWIKPWGVIFLNLLKLIAVPLIFVSLVKGITSLTDISKLSKIGIKTITLFMFTTVLATFIGLFSVNMIKPGNTFPKEKQTELLAKYNENIEKRQESASEIKNNSPLQVIVDIVPDNIFAAASDNSRMLQIIFFAFLFGIAIVLLPQGSADTVIKFFGELNDIILRIIDMIMSVAPYGVFALMAGLVVDFSGDADIFAALGLYAINVIIALLVMVLIVYPILLKILSKQNILSYFKDMLPAQLVAFSTSSSAATLPVTMEQCTEKIGVSKHIASFVLPVGVTVNMDGTSAYQAIAAVFIAQVFGIELSLSAQLTIVLMSVLGSIGTPGIPGGSIVMLIIVMSSVGIPIEGLALILGIDRPLDMMRTVVNVTGDSTVAVIVDYSEKKKLSKEFTKNQSTDLEIETTELSKN